MSDTWPTFPDGPLKDKIKEARRELIAQQNAQIAQNQPVYPQNTQNQGGFKVPRILQHPGRIRTERLSILNTTYRETNLSITPDGRYLFFMSGRGQMPWSNPTHTTYKGRPEHDGDIWFSQRQGKQWQYPRCLDNSVNTYNGEDEPNISPDGQTVYFQSWGRSWEQEGGPYYQARLSGTRWSQPTALGGGIHQFFMESARKNFYQPYATDGATVSADGKIFIVAAGPTMTGKWISTSAARMPTDNGLTYSDCPSAPWATNALPFWPPTANPLLCLQWLRRWGGLDIFKTVINEDGSVGEVINVGAPLNTWLDDYCLVLTASGEDAYFVREGDIYYADTREASPELRPFSATLMIAGTITDGRSQKGTDARIIIKNAKTGQIIAQSQSNTASGEYAIVLPTGETQFVQDVTKEGLLPFSKSFQVQIREGLNRIESNVTLNAPQVAVKNEPEGDQEAKADVGEKQGLKEQ
ncbi:MAG: hypothetical protein HC880_17530 [Bacteroidia bacterium]|nr:hypothetical protein [Bacteroidia bacterium]